MPETPVPAARIALFIDIENLVGSASTIGLPIDISPVLDRLKEYGKVQVRRSFGDLDKCLSSIRRESEVNQIRRMLHHNLVQMEDIPFVTANKNTADITLAIEALSLAFQYEDISHFAILASDRDYVPLYNKLHELGRTVIAVGVDQSNTHQMIREAADILFYYEALFNRPTEGVLAETEEDRKDLLLSYFADLSQAIRILDNQETKTVGAVVAALMRQKRSDFSPELVGCTGFKEFVKRAEQENIVNVQWNDDGEDFIIRVDKNTPLSQTSIMLPQPELSRDADSLAHYYEQILESKLRLPLPSHKGRHQILNALKDTYSEMTAEGPFPLREWSEQATHKLRQMSVAPKTAESAYKILLSLYFARCFHCEESFDKHNPTIVGLAHGEDLWEQRLNYLFTRTILYAIKPDRIVPEALCILLYGKDNRDIEKVSALLQEVMSS